jgi:hypothetical protein
VRPLQHRRRGHDGWLHDVPQLRRFEVRLSATCAHFATLIATTNSN